MGKYTKYRTGYGYGSKNGRLTKMLKGFIPCVHCGMYLHSYELAVHEFVCTHTKVHSQGKVYIKKPSAPPIPRAPRPAVSAVMLPDRNYVVLREDAISMAECGIVVRVKFPHWYKLVPNISNSEMIRFLKAARKALDAGCTLEEVRI